MGRAVLTRDQLLRSQIAPPCMEGERRGAPELEPTLSLAALPSETALLYCLHSAGGQCTVPSAPTALSLSLLPASSLSWLLALPTCTPHRAQLSCLYAEPRSRLTGALTLAYPQPHPPGGGACSSSPQASAPQPSLGRLNTGFPSQVKANQHSLPTSGGSLNAQSTSKGALWEQPPSTERGQMSMPSPSLPSLQLTPPH